MIVCDIKSSKVVRN